MTDIETLKKKCTKQEAAELAIHHNARIACLKNYKDEPTAAHKRDLDAASNGLQELVDQLSVKYPEPPAPSTSSASPAAPGVLANTRQVHLYLQGLGWKCAYNTVAKDIKAGKLAGRRGGGFTRQTVDQYAMTHLTKRVDADPGKDAAWSEPVNPDAAGAQERRVSADADLKEVEAKRKRFLFERERGKYVQTSIIGRELAERWQAVRLRMGSFGRELSGEICELFGGEPVAAGEVIQVVAGDPERADGLQRFCLSRREELAALFRERTRDVLSAFADDTWLTEDMATAWEKYEQERNATEIESMRELIARVGGDETRAAEMVAMYRVQEVGK